MQVGSLGFARLTGMDGAAIFRKTAATANKAMLPLLRSGPGQRLFGKSFVTLTYTGRKSGREIVLPVNYRRDGADLVVGVLAPDAKKWWRNFTGDGADVSVRIGATTSAGHARAVRDEKGAVSVRITLAS